MTVKRSTFAMAVFVVAAAFAAPTGEGGDKAKRFVLCDPLLKAPAACYALEPGWTGMGGMNYPSTNGNFFVRSTILFNPEKRMVVQDTSPVSNAPWALKEIPQIYQDADAMARHAAEKINSAIVVPGLEGFVAKGGRFSDYIPEKTRKLIQTVFATDRMSQIKRAFKVECFFDCTYLGVPCEARCEFTTALRVFKLSSSKAYLIGATHDFDTKLLVAPKGQLPLAASTGGRMFARAFENLMWKAANERIVTVLATGKTMTREACQTIMEEELSKTGAATLKRDDYVRKYCIPPDETVENPFAPGEKVTRPALFDYSWLDSSPDLMILSSRDADPKVMRDLIKRSEWHPAIDK